MKKRNEYFKLANFKFEETKFFKSCLKNDV